MSLIEVAEQLAYLSLLQVHGFCEGHLYKTYMCQSQVENEHWVKIILQLL